MAGALTRECSAFLNPLLTGLDTRMDSRLVSTLADTVTALIRQRNRPAGLLLSELGGYLTSPTHAPAGTKRLANLLHSARWEASAVETYVLTLGEQQVQAAVAQDPGGRALCILDGSVAEKPESTQAAGLGPVRSSKARRLARPRPRLGPGYYRGAPGPPIVVPGFHWIACLVPGWPQIGVRPPLTLGAWHWYAHPPPAGEAGPAGVPCQSDREAQHTVLERITTAWGVDKLLHVWDRGFSGAPWLGEALDRGWHFVVRWKKGNRLRLAEAPSVGNPDAPPSQQEADGREAWQLTASKYRWRRQVPDLRHPGQQITVRFGAVPVRLLHQDDPLWLVIVRRDRGQRRQKREEPWRLLTTEPAETEEQAWRVVKAYTARWQVEQTLRYGKSELGVESVRVRDWEPRRKLLALVSLAYAFLVTLLGDSTGAPLAAILRWAHRTGRQARDLWRPLYRLRSALAALWQRYSPSLRPLPP